MVRARAKITTQPLISGRKSPLLPDPGHMNRGRSLEGPRRHTHTYTHTRTMSTSSWPKGTKRMGH